MKMFTNSSTVLFTKYKKKLKFDGSSNNDDDDEEIFNKSTWKHIFFLGERTKSHPMILCALSGDIIDL